MHQVRVAITLLRDKGESRRCRQLIYLRDRHQLTGWVSMHPLIA